MKNKKVIISVISVIVMLLVLIMIGFIFNGMSNNIFNYAEKNYEKVVFTEVVNEENNENQNNIEEINNEMNIEDARLASVSKNEMIEKLSSRSEVERLNINPLYIATKESSEKDYEEIKECTKLEDVKISFDMDVSKVTGLSQDDFVKLVAGMKYDRTGILERNAAWIWECCQKYQVNEIFVLGVCGIESGWCSAAQHQRTHNYSSLMTGGHLIQYASDAQGFEAMIKLLGNSYLKPGGGMYHGKTITAVGTCYCNPTSWPGKVFKCMNQVFE